jgi:hypothetical protein
MVEIKSIGAIQDRGDQALAFSGKTRITKQGIICQGLFGFPLDQAFQASGQNTLRSI